MAAKPISAFFTKAAPSATASSGEPSAKKAREDAGADLAGGIEVALAVVVLLLSAEEGGGVYFPFVSI